MIRNIGFIGVGNMASAIIGGITSVGNYPWKNIGLYDLLTDKTNRFHEKGATVFSTIKELYDNSDCVVLSVKPQNFPEILKEIDEAQKANQKHTLYITIAAGISTESICQTLGNVPIVRALPNTPMLIGKGVSAICKNEYVSDEEFGFACNVFENAGKVLIIDESEMNRIISVTSSSPAYVFKFIKAICDGASVQGLALDPDSVKKAVCGVLAGAAEMLAESDLSADELISMVCSKGGTTERAVAELDRLDFSNSVIAAMLKCTERADELGNQNK
jgi:pyrroline-5-carboxylate reductase